MQGSFEVQYKDGTKEVLASYERIFGCDGTFSAVLNEFRKCKEFIYELKESEYGYTEFYIPPGSDGNFRIPGNVYYQWPTKRDIAIWALPNPEGDFNIAVYMKLKGDYSFEHFKDKP